MSRSLGVILKEIVAFETPKFLGGKSNNKPTDSL